LSGVDSNREVPVLKPALLASTALLLGAPVSHQAIRHSAPGLDAEDILAKTRAAYAALTSYADSGTVLDETSGFTDRSTFRTLFIRDPRYLLIDYRAVASEYTNGFRLPLDHRTVLWMENGELQAWASKTDAHETYTADGGQQVNALKSAAYSTAGISLLVPSHLYSKSGLASAVQAMEEAEADGFETVNGRRCFRILGVERWRYPSGRETGVRPITLWVDAETYLIHKVLQDTPKGMPRGSISRRITTLKHQANPKLDPAQFRFTVPTS
jgi:outer membrane lipoprotein-sorting protein